MRSSPAALVSQAVQPQQNNWRKGSSRRRVITIFGVIMIWCVVGFFFSLMRAGDSGHHHEQKGPQKTKRFNIATTQKGKRPLSAAPKRETVLPSTPTATSVVDFSNNKDNNNNQHHQPRQPDLAYVMVISNEQYVDGALVLGHTLRKNSPLLLSGRADLVLLSTKGRVGDHSRERLRRVGFTVLQEVPSLAPRVPTAFFKDTFDKLYMFKLTQYEKVVFMDSDMLVITPGMDALFNKTLKSKKHVAAIGNAPYVDVKSKQRKTYFQTGMMIFHPSEELAADIFEEFDSNTPPRNPTGFYTHGNARDGLLIRRYFGERYQIIDNKYSRNMDPRIQLADTGAVALHFRGIIKPWYDYTKPNTRPELGKKEFGHNYIKWWAEYEEIHRKSAAYLGLDPEEAKEGRWGGRAAGPGITPQTHAWLMRYSPTREYVQLLSWVDEARRNVTLPTLVPVACEDAGDSCTQCCEKYKPEHNYVCSPQSFHFSWMNTCETLGKIFVVDGCRECFLGIYSKQKPGNYHPGMEVDNGKRRCRFNLLRDDHTKPTCDANHTSTRRLCGCVRREVADDENVKVIPFTG
eukprot:PhM_4_TR1862/c0_g1_i1/m.6968